MSSIHKEELNWIIDAIDGLSTPSYLKQIIGRPTIPVFFVRVLQLMLKSLHVPEERARIYAVAVTLLDMGQVMHDRVTVDSQPEPDAHRKQQLYVLAGDYFSSIFYQQLAKHQETEGLAFLLEEIGRMNEKKMTFHMAQETFASKVEEWEQMREISGGLLVALADFFHADQPEPTPWRDIVKELMVLRYIKDSGTSCDTGAETAWVQSASQRLNEATAKLEDDLVKDELNILIREAMPFT
ncbi:hypothetical protein ADL26_19880 [Thermoactinomyces vulgaris]|jgi:heptaprenyl diphosphate synthase|nr:hypothetical protein ADL26_19880 [Thermoactinomyces vulgaris]